MLTPVVSKPYRKLCTPSTPLTENLFGDDLHKEIKDLNEMKFTHALSTDQRKENLTLITRILQKTKIFRQGLQSDYKKSILDKRACPYRKKSKCQGTGRKQ